MEGVAEEDAEDTVLGRVGFVLVKGYKDEGVFHEVPVLKKGREEVVEPFARDGYGGIVTVRSHVWGNKHPLRKLVGFEIFVEEGCVLNLREAVGFCCYGVIEDFGVVLADVIVGTVLLVDPCEALEACVWHIFLVEAPADALVFKKVNDGRYIFWDGSERIAIKTEIVSFSQLAVVSRKDIATGG